MILMKTSTTARRVNVCFRCFFCPGQSFIVTCEFWMRRASVFQDRKMSWDLQIGTYSFPRFCSLGARTRRLLSNLRKEVTCNGRASSMVCLYATSREVDFVTSPAGLSLTNALRRNERRVRTVGESLGIFCVSVSWTPRKVASLVSHRLWDLNVFLLLVWEDEKARLVLCCSRG